MHDCFKWVLMLIPIYDHACEIESAYVVGLKYCLYMNDNVW
jgi:hypothetical protein